MGKKPQAWLQMVPQTKGDGDHLSSGHQDYTMSLKQLHRHFKGHSKASHHNLTRSYSRSTWDLGIIQVPIARGQKKSPTAGGSAHPGLIPGFPQSSCSRICWGHHQGGCHLGAERPLQDVSKSHAPCMGHTTDWHTTDSNLKQVIPTPELLGNTQVSFSILTLLLSPSSVQPIMC